MGNQIKIDNVGQLRAYIVELEVRLKDALFEINRCHRVEIAYNKLKEDNRRLAQMYEDCDRRSRGLKLVNDMTREEFYAPQF